MKRYPKKNEQLWFFGEYNKENFPDYPEPKDDNERFINLWCRWQFGNEAKAWDEMWLLVLVLCRKAARLEIKRKGLHFKSSDIEEFALDAAGELMTRLKKYWGYSYKYIVTAAAKAVKHPLYRNKNEEMLEKQALDLLNNGEASSWDEVKLLLAEKKEKTKEDQLQLWLPF
ncbi:hypothetical protein [Treponema sp.]|uniref:hypothetical protein n=1 Tax=Treponema sp. TaxID=166 RepID=UPI0025D9E834|nr:hypothetical protein [Treponema sp.]MCR5218599.1 hypothetical protein [Treponema sp.]